MRAENALVSLRISAGSPDPFVLSIAITSKSHYAGIILCKKKRFLDIEIEKNKILKDIKKNTQNKKYIE